MVYGKVGTDLAQRTTAWLKACGQHGLLKACSMPKINPNGIKYCKNLDNDVAELACLKRYSEQEIKKAYDVYARAPFVNQVLRSGAPLSDEGATIVNCLKQAIQESEPVSGKFYRGLTGTRQKFINEDTIKDFIFDNKGFTSATPEINRRYAESFVIGRNSALVEFDIKNMPAFRANNYEVIFDTQAFNKDMFEIIKLDDGFFRVIQK